MSPNILGTTLLTEAANATSFSQSNAERHILNGSTKQLEQSDKRYILDIVWRNVIVMAYFYLGGIYGLYLFVTACKWPTVYWCAYLMIIGILGATAGAHRLWTHNSYKARLPLRILLAYFQTSCFENCIHEWVRDHRMHHKYTDTDADPHNATRGFFFSHVGWLLVRKHVDVREKGKIIYMKDVEADPVVMFQKKYFFILMPLCTFILPAVIPWYFWQESFATAWYTASIFRYILNINGTWLVNSAAHIYGTRPYDKNIAPAENAFVGYISMGEGWHNYHHVFPWDYKAAEFNGYASNLTSGFIDVMAKIGWAYDLKSASEEMIRRRKARTGENAKAHGVAGTKIDGEKYVWGWGDEEMSDEEKKDAVKYNALQEESM